MISIDKVTLNIGVGQPGEKMDKAKMLLQKLTNQKPIEMITKKRVPVWDVKKGEKIGTKVTLRGKKAKEVLIQCLKANDNILKESSFDKQGNASFGIKEYIDLPNMKYDPTIGMLGMDVNITLKKWGYRLAKRKIRPVTIPKKHFVKKEEAIDFMKKNFSVEVAP